MNERVEKIQISGIRKFAQKVNMNKDAISLTIGQPDFKVPKAVEEGMVNAIKEGETSYTSNIGIEELREEISKYLKTFHINYTKDEICITVGGSEGLYSVLMTLLNEGDKILIPSPGYPAYENIATMLGANIINYGYNEDFTLNIKEIRKYIKKDNISYLVLSFPSNPTGAILSKTDRDELVDLIREEDIIVITDEMYASIIFDTYYSVAQVEDIKDKVIYVSGFSKMFSMTGLRVGYVAASEKYMSQILKVHQYGVSCAPSISQYGALEGLKNSKVDVEIMKNTFMKRRDYCIKRLNEMKIDVVEPQGAFYIFPSIKKFNMGSEEFCEKLLEYSKVGFVPGNAFGILGEGYMRISYCYCDDILKEGLDRLEEFLKVIK